MYLSIKLVPDVLFQMHHRWLPTLLPAKDCLKQQHCSGLIQEPTIVLDRAYYHEARWQDLGLLFLFLSGESISKLCSSAKATRSAFSHASSRAIQEKLFCLSRFIIWSFHLDRDEQDCQQFAKVEIYAGVFFQAPSSRTLRTIR
ncbi:Threonine synthase [Clarias magur]|uniref:Threonine synthase n=1 Tax=Clarias magur TaxID=1594786 RepID=A0A8J4UMF4_CLAMG|nr:Threonine synthase [Clarias magur]